MSRGDALNNHKAYSFRGILEARVGFEPTNGGFADLSLGPLGYRAETLSIANAPLFSLFSRSVFRAFSMAWAHLPAGQTNAQPYRRTVPTLFPKARRETEIPVVSKVPASSGSARALFLCRHRRCDPRFAQEPRRFLRRRRIDVEARAPFESRHFRQFRNNLHMPVIVIVDLFSDRRSMNHEVVGRPVQHRVDAHQCVLQHARKACVHRALV